MRDNRGKNILQLHFIVFIFGFTSVLGALISISALPLTIYRMGIASLFLALFIFFYDINKFKLKKPIVIKILICGVLIALHWITFFYAIKISNVSITVSMMSSAAFLTSLIEPLFFKKKFLLYELILGVLSLFGVFIIFNAELKYIDGLIVALISSILVSVFTLLNSRIVINNSSITISFYELFVGFLFSLLYYYLFFDESLILKKTNNQDFMLLVILGIVCTSYAFTKSVDLIKYLKPFTIMMIINMEPVYAILISLLIFGESEYLSINFYIGFVIILIGVIINGIFKYKKNKISYF
mgnify:CR=1 FL=1|tara:strand:- start:53 stop:946 length:894 start_codon:yes stop_codon:yes gene_type:complete